MTHRELPPEEWPRLVGTELEAVWPHLQPAWARVLVVEDEGQIVGCWAALLMVHAEGVYIAPDHQKRGAVARHLWRGMRQMIQQSWQASRVLTASRSPEVSALLEAHGALKLDVESYVLPMEAHSSCLQPF